MPLIGIRADGDAGAEAGMGHVYRSVAYAHRLTSDISDLTVHFFMRDFPEGIRKVRSEGFAITTLPRRPKFGDYEYAFGENTADLLIIDTLGSSDALMQAGRKTSQAIVTIDDLESSAAEADVIVNGILWGTRLLPEPFGRAQVYQGVEYIQLRDQFVAANQKPRAIAKNVQNILISTGGADDRRFAFQLMEAVAQLPFQCRATLLAGPAFRETPRLREAAESMSNRVQFSVVENVTNMADYLSAADIAIITGGTVMFESATCGTPAVVVSSYEHQVPQANWFSERGAAIHLGYSAGHVDLLNVRNAIYELACDRTRRRSMSEAGKRSVDGKGLDRFVAIAKESLRRVV